MLEDKKVSEDIKAEIRALLPKVRDAIIDFTSLPYCLD